MLRRIIYYAKFPFLEKEHNRIKVFLLSTIYLGSLLYAFYQIYQKLTKLNFNLTQYPGITASLERKIRIGNEKIFIECLPYLLIAAVPLIFAFISYLIEPYYTNKKTD